MTVSTFNATAQADRVAEGSAVRAGVRVGEAADMASLRAVSALLEAVWGRTDEGVPLASDVLRGLVHAGGAVTVAHDRAEGALVGAAVAVRAAGPTCYSLIAAAAPGTADRGIGTALKLRQRAWALREGLTTMTWTFDPLVARNARFNLVKLGARAGEYEPAFYGAMADAINGAGDADRLVASWELAGRAAVSATEGTAPQPAEPAGAAEVLGIGPDGEPSHLGADGVAWIRVPHDIVRLRREDPAAAAQWRRTTRAAFTDAFATGLQATGLSRAAWYQLERKEAQ